METSLVRFIILIIVTLLFIQQARRARSRTHKRRAFVLAAVAVGLFVLLNGLQISGANVAPLMLPVLSIAVLLLAISAVFLVRGWRSGEMSEQVAQVRDMIAKERERNKK
jgi:Ca2+/Na+ antiporter